MPIVGFENLIALMSRLRDKDKGCPWDLAQTPQTLTAYLLEEAYETVEAIGDGNPEAVCEELGDLLFQIIFQTRIQEERGNFNIGDVIGKISEKMVRRHPHIFGDAKASTPEEVRENWEVIKQKEKGLEYSILSGTPKALPALLRAWRISQKAASVGFDWNNPSEVMDKIKEEIGEIEGAVGKPEQVKHEVGDLLFAIVNLARHLEVNPEEALAKATDRFEGRFRYIEERLRERSLEPSKVGLMEMENLWQEAKKKGL